jgi:hypothetical protein
MMSSASPAANSEQAGTGKTWFKVWDWAPTYSKSTGLVFASEGVTNVTFTLPKSLPSGQYLLRLEQIALHAAGSYGGAQFYIGCAQINVVNGGSGTPGPLVSIPGVYTGYEPGILIVRPCPGQRSAAADMVPRAEHVQPAGKLHWLPGPYVMLRVLCNGC